MNARECWASNKVCEVIEHGFFFLLPLKGGPGLCPKVRLQFGNLVRTCEKCVSSREINFFIGGN